MSISGFEPSLLGGHNAIAQPLVLPQLPINNIELRVALMIFQNCVIHPECNDPIFRCFDLAKAATKMANKTPEYRSEYEEIARQCRNFSVQLLNQCVHTDEVQTLLSESSGTSKYFRYTESIR